MITSLLALAVAAGALALVALMWVRTRPSGPRPSPS